MAEPRIFSESSTSADEMAPILSGERSLPENAIESVVCEPGAFTEETPNTNNGNIGKERPPNEDGAYYTEHDFYDVVDTGSLEKTMKHVIIDSDSDEELSGVMRLELADHTYDARSPSKRYQERNEEKFSPIVGLSEYFEGVKTDGRPFNDRTAPAMPQLFHRMDGYSNNGSPQVYSRPDSGIVASQRTRNEFASPILRSPNQHGLPKRQPGQHQSIMGQTMPQRTGNRGLPTGVSGNSVSFTEPLSPQHTSLKDPQRLMMLESKRPVRPPFITDANRTLTHPSNAPMLTSGRGPRQVPRGRGGSTSMVHPQRGDIDGDDDDALTLEPSDGISGGHSPLKQVHFAESNFGRNANPLVSGARTNRPPPPHRTGAYSPPKTVIPPHRILQMNSGANAPTLTRHIPRTSQSYLLGTSNPVASGNDIHDMPDNLIDQGPEKPVSLRDSALPPDIAEIAAELNNVPTQLPAPDSSSGKNEMKAKIQAIMNNLKQQEPHYEESTSPRSPAKVNPRNRNSVSTSSSNFEGASPRRITSPPQRNDLRGPRTYSMRPPGSSPVRTNMDFNSQLMAPISKSAASPSPISRPSWVSSQETAHSGRRDAVKATRSGLAKIAKKLPPKSDTSGEESEEEEDWEAGCICEMDHVTEKMVECEKCKLWQHSECLGMREDEYNRISEGVDQFVCEKCIPKILRFTRMEARNMQARYLKEVASIKQNKKRVNKSVDHSSAKSSSSSRKIKLQPIKETKKQTTLKESKTQSTYSAEAEKLLRGMPDSTMHLDIPSKPKCSSRLVDLNTYGMVAEQPFLRDDVGCELFGSICLPNECKNNRIPESTISFIYDGLPKTGNNKKNSYICLELQKSKDVEIRRSCRPNCVLKHSLQDHKLRFYLVATEDFNVPTELCLPFDIGTRSSPSLSRVCKCSKDEVCLFMKSPADVPLGHSKVANNNPTSDVSDVPLENVEAVADIPDTNNHPTTLVKEERSEEESLSFPKASEEEINVKTPVNKRGRTSKRQSEEASVKEEVISKTRSTRNRSSVVVVDPPASNTTSERTSSLREQRKLAEVEKIFAKNDSTPKEGKLKKDAVGESSNARSKSRKRTTEEVKNRISSLGSLRTPVGKTKDFLRRHEADIAADSLGFAPVTKKRRTSHASGVTINNKISRVKLDAKSCLLTRNITLTHFVLPEDINVSIKPSVENLTHPDVDKPNKSKVPEEPVIEVVPEPIAIKEKTLTVAEYRKRKSTGTQNDVSPISNPRSSPRKRGFIPAMDNLQANDSVLPSIPLPLPSDSPTKESALLPPAIPIDELKRQVLHKDVGSPSASSLRSPKSGEQRDEEYTPSMSIADRLKNEWGIKS